MDNKFGQIMAELHAVWSASDPEAESHRMIGEKASAY
jgi:hypothetical protein